MVIKNGTDPVIEKRKRHLNLTGDVYIYEGHFIESLKSHRRLIPDSTASTIEEAYDERVEYEARRAAEREAMAKAAAEAEGTGGEEE